MLTDLDRAAADFAAARQALRETTTRLIFAVRAALDAGMSESEAARRAGVTRMTIRSWKDLDLP